ncbi:shikimate 5-dehydrogenase [Azospirillum picis]|uniref:Shikimate dehydrogenase n=1 Tax=Azospirillum picis TaxID=488438 RepID=A0ABU0ML12_9PROT|nr:shikimate 5-dehydrogenase [Azospirillum picis]MBP2300361.1 shikimate dehydrogenase [Azospirillum picis]MDQ0534157.1 shikimate dehydrogenase [Azospirillum picis]
MPNRINKDTRLCISLSGRPSNIGTRFHNHLYEALGLDYVYKAFTTDDLPGAITGIRALGIRGCGVSMPFKEACIPFLDELDPSAAGLQSVNTIVNDGGRLRGYNTDYSAVRALLDSHAVPRSLPFALRGSGGMARAVLCAIRDAGFADGRVVARNERTGRRLAEEYGLPWQPDTAGIPAGSLLVNVTPLGMAGGLDADTLSFEPALVEAAAHVFDVVAMPAETPLIRAARAAGKPVITGAAVIALQALEQFVLYTGVRPSDEQVAAAAAHSRA